MKRKSASQRSGLPLLSVPVPWTRATPTKPLKSPMELGSPPTLSGVDESAGPGRWKWASGPPNGLGTSKPPEIGMGATTLGRLRSSSGSRNNLRPSNQGKYFIFALLFDGGLRYHGKNIAPARAD